MIGRLYFNHIPRTAGTTVRVWLASFFSPSLVCPFLHPHEFREAPDAELRSYSFFSGHLQDLPLRTFGREVSMITVLREPRSHLASLITYYAKTRLCPMSATPEQIREKSKEVLHTHIDKKYAASWAAINQQTKWLNSLDPAELHATSEKDIESAHSMLDAALVVGTLDRLQDFADLVCYNMRWPHRPMNQHLNASPSDNLLDDIDSEHLDALLEPDTNLYQHAQRRLEKEIVECFGSDANADRRASVINEKAFQTP